MSHLVPRDRFSSDTSGKIQSRTCEAHLSFGRQLIDYAGGFCFFVGAWEGLVTVLCSIEQTNS
jgi:hypothetical protein